VGVWNLSGGIGFWWGVVVFLFHSAL
jgi:hypothetical protein